MSAVKMGLTIEEAAECTGIGRNTMRKLVDWGKLPALKVGRKAIIRRDTLERFMAVNQGTNAGKSFIMYFCYFNQIKVSSMHTSKRR